MVRVVCDVASIDREFDYVVPDRLLDRWGVPLRVGTMVRVPLHGRQVAGWVVALDVEPPPGVELRAVTRISGVGPPGDVVELCRWAAWRWAGRLPALLGTASPPTMVERLPGAVAPPGGEVGSRVGSRVASLFESPVSVIRLPPAASPMEVVRAAAARGPVLVVAPTFAAVASLSDGLRRSGIPTAVHPDGWARAAAGSSLVGTRTAAFAPVRDVAAIVVVDEHDEALQREGSPTWHARDVAVERGRRAGVPVVLVSPVPSVEALTHTGGAVTTIDRARERRGWGRLIVVDRRADDLARTGLFSEAVTRVLRSDRRVVCVLNRTGRSALLGCRSCGTLAGCERCGAAVRHADDGTLVCPRCTTVRPPICAECASTSFRSIRLGVTKAHEHLEALVREPVDEIVGSSPTRGRQAGRSRRVSIGTEAALQRVEHADAVIFLEFDQELGAPRYRAAEQALALLARASRIVGGRDGEVLAQTLQPDHPVLDAALHADPGPLVAAEAARRRLLALPPAATVAYIGGEAAPAFVAALASSLAALPDAVLDQRDDASWLVRSTDRTGLLDALASVVRPPGRLRLQVDPARLPG